ncbi:MAG: hypothetical protein HY644_02570 [Acidobacteria bacterium]|nr:hypothetical protein [Acidobacteriota bacterium]
METEVERKEMNGLKQSANRQGGLHADEASPPTEAQRIYIASLARDAGLKVDVSGIPDRKAASLFIERLRLLNRRMGNSSDDNRDRKVAFGLATKLIFRRYLDQQKDPRKWKRFWKDVYAFYGEYCRHQQLATVGSRIEGHLAPSVPWPIRGR